MNYRSNILYFQPLSSVYMNFVTKNLLTYLWSAASTVKTMSMIFSYLLNFTLKFETQ